MTEASLGHSRFLTSQRTLAVLTQFKIIGFTMPHYLATSNRLAVLCNLFDTSLLIALYLQPLAYQRTAKVHRSRL